MELELSSEVKTNSKVLIPLKAVDLKELIQEDTAEGQPHGECPLETDKVTEKFILKRCASIPFFSTLLWFIDDLCGHFKNAFYLCLGLINLSFFFAFYSATNCCNF